MRNTWWIVALALAATACKKDSVKPDDKAKLSGAPVAVPATPMVVDVAAVDALWALAPPGAIGGGVITGNALVLVDSAVTNLRGILARTPLLSAAGDVDPMKRAIVGMASSYAEAGVALDRGLAFFSDGPRTVTVLPVADRAKFVAARGGTTKGDTDKIDGATCKMVGQAYACSEDPAYLVLGGGDLGMQAGIGGQRGDGELVFTLPQHPPSALPLVPSGPLRMTLNIRGGELVVRGHLPAKLLGPLATLASYPAAKIDVDSAAGFLILPFAVLGPMMPDKPIVPGVSARAVLTSITGPLQAVVPAGATDVDVRAPLSDPKPMTALLAACGALPGANGALSQGPDGTCVIGPAQLGFTGTLWVEGNELRGAKAKGPAPKPTTASPPSTAGRELAGYTFAAWGHGLMFDTGFAGLPAETAAVLRAFSSVTELGMGADFGPDGIKFLLVGRTIHQNPDAVFTRLDAALASGDIAIAEALAKENPGTPLAHDFAAGRLGVAMPASALGITAAVAIPAFLEYMRAGKGPESEVNLNRIVKAAKIHRVRMGEFPVGRSALVPAKDCCTTPKKKCDPDPAAWAKDPIWSALDFAIDEPHYFQYRYEGTPTTFTVTAEADLDCDRQGKTVRIARGSLDTAGNPTVVFETAPGQD